MRHVTAIVKPFVVDDVLTALARFAPAMVSVEEARGYGRQKGHLELYRGSEYTITFLPKMMIQTVVSQAQVNDVIEAITGAARTGRIGDGKVFVCEVTVFRVSADGLVPWRA